MPRDSSGNYSLPPGNPVVTGEVIASSWANTTLDDIGTALTASLDRSGEGGMLAGLQLFAGTIGAPGLTWTLETTSGLYRAGAGDFRWAMGGSDVWSINTFGLTSQWMTLSGADPRLRINESDAAANNRLWDISAVSEQLRFRVTPDADNSYVNWLTVDRTGQTVDSIALTATALAWNGVAMVNLASNPTWTGNHIFSGGSYGGPSITGTDVLLELNESDAGSNEKIWWWRHTGGVLFLQTRTDAGGAGSNAMTVTRSGTTPLIIDFPSGVLQTGGNEVGRKFAIYQTSSGAAPSISSSDSQSVISLLPGSATVNLPGNLTTGTVVVLVNDSGGSVSLAGSSGGTVYWFDGTTRVGPATRTLAYGGVATCVSNNSGAWLVWGSGIS